MSTLEIVLLVLLVAAAAAIVWLVFAVIDERAEAKVTDFQLRQASTTIDNQKHQLEGMTQVDAGRYQQVRQLEADLKVTLRERDEARQRRDQLVRDLQRERDRTRRLRHLLVHALMENGRPLTIRRLTPQESVRRFVDAMQATYGMGPKPQPVPGLIDTGSWRIRVRRSQDGRFEKVKLVTKQAETPQQRQREEWL